MFSLFFGSGRAGDVYKRQPGSCAGRRVHRPIHLHARQAETGHGKVRQTHVSYTHLVLFHVLDYLDLLGMEVEPPRFDRGIKRFPFGEIGRASCRERV